MSPWLKEIFDYFPESIREDLEERMAIFEFEAGMPRAKAEIKAVLEAKKKLATLEEPS